VSASSWQVAFIIGPAAGGFILQAEPFALWPLAAVVCLVGGFWALALDRRLPQEVRRTPRRATPAPEPLVPAGLGESAAG
jgi:MFS family permease